MMNRYEIIIYYDGNDLIYVAEMPELAGCSAHGNTEEEALANVKEAMELWIEAAVERSEPVPVPRERRLMYA